MAMSVEETLHIATEAHWEQTDMDGKTVIFQIMAVAVVGKNEFEQKVRALV